MSCHVEIKYFKSDTIIEIFNIGDAIAGLDGSRKFRSFFQSHD